MGPVSDSTARQLSTPSFVFSTRQRDDGSGASLVLFDSTASWVEFHRVEYDLTLTAHKAVSAGLRRRPYRPWVSTAHQLFTSLVG